MIASYRLSAKYKGNTIDEPVEFDDVMEEEI